MNMLLPKWCFNGVIYQCAIKENTWLSLLWRPGEAWNGRVWVQQCSFCWRAGVELCPLGMAWLLPSKSEYLCLPTPLARLDPVTFCSAGEGDSQGSKWVVTSRIRGLPRPRLQQGHGWITALGRGRLFLCSEATCKLSTWPFTLDPINIHSQTHWPTKVDLSGLLVPDGGE